MNYNRDKRFNYSHEDLKAGQLLFAWFDNMPFRFRRGPVPWVASGKGWCRSYRVYRNNHGNLKKFVASLGEDERIKKSVYEDFPTTWDDDRRACNYDRNWKRFRKTQYK